MTNKIYALMMAAFISGSAAHSAPIDGWTEKALQENETLLKSVIKIQMGAFFSRSTCSSTLIAKNILMTARHCADEMKVGDSINLNGNPLYQVVGLVMQPQLELTTKISAQGKTYNSVLSTDIALIHFRSTSCQTSTLKDIEPIKLAKPAQKGSLSDRVLLAGYGITNPQGSDSGTLRAGYNELAISDYSAGDTAIANLIRSMTLMQQTPSVDDALILVGGRTEVVSFFNEAGKKISTEAVSQSKTDRAEEALVLSGDSGGAAFAFDSKNRPYVVGVTSKASGGTVIPESVVVVDGDTRQPIFAMELKNASTPAGLEMSKAMEIAMQELLRRKYVDESDTVLKTFGIGLVGKRFGSGKFSSLINANNAAFLDKNLTNLQNAQKTAKYCQ